MSCAEWMNIRLIILSLNFIESGSDEGAGQWGETLSLGECFVELPSAALSLAYSRPRVSNEE